MLLSSLISDLSTVGAEKSTQRVAFHSLLKDRPSPTTVEDVELTLQGDVEASKVSLPQDKVNHTANPCSVTRNTSNPSYSTQNGPTMIESFSGTHPYERPRPNWTNSTLYFDMLDSLSYEQVSQVQCCYSRQDTMDMEAALDLSPITQQPYSHVLDVETHLRNSTLLREMEMEEANCTPIRSTPYMDRQSTGQYSQCMGSPNISVIPSEREYPPLATPPRRRDTACSPMRGFNTPCDPLGGPPRPRNWSLGDFDIVAKVGEGRFGKIYLAQERQSGFGVVLKCISKEMILYNDLLVQLRREIELQSYVSRHCKNALKLFAYFWDADRVFFVLEYADGGDLLNFMKVKEITTLPETLFRSIARDILTALSFMHRHNIYHRDIKPENILMCDDTAKLADFSWCVRSMSRSYTICGTLDYLSPEQVEQRGVSSASDMWSFGVLCYELLVGRVPFADDSPSETCRKIVSGVMEFPDQLSEEAASFLRALLVVDEEKRLSAAEALQHTFLNPTPADSPNVAEPEGDVTERDALPPSKSEECLSERCVSLPRFAAVKLSKSGSGKQGSTSTFLSDISLSTNSFTFSPSSLQYPAAAAPPSVTSTVIVSDLTVLSAADKDMSSANVSSMSSPSPPTPELRKIDCRRFVDASGYEGKHSLSSGGTAGVSVSTKVTSSQSTERGLDHPTTPRVISSYPLGEGAGDACALQLQFDDISSELDGSERSIRRMETELDGSSPCLSPVPFVNF
ncbi:Protein kinase domain/Protein tyrosine kinase, putative [Angomonas deanei]|uniref:Aurora kinase n=1 Tax=Angomonas deanei TaxID=59799 RepID=A0A7G2CNI3_9TRYP|nr:Protein kinase domain/Protein tyrosine kinase, putative [Angomonas deanei]